MPDEHSIASPLNLLNEEEAAREVLLLSYTVNLEFWERYALSVARGLGARVTVVGDAAMVSGDPVHVRYAGITYLQGRAACASRQPFHPKLLVIAGDDYATVAIGSGNVTLAGWHDNAELWSVLRGDAGGAPDTFIGLAGWLRALPGRVSFSAGVQTALERVAQALERLPATEPGPQLLTSLDRSIASQLPDMKADELIIASPFYDAGGEGLADLLERFKPDRTRLFMQPRDVVANGNVLADLLEGRGGKAETIEEDRYHHGKLIEWTSGDRRFALTGSPNVSRPALLDTLAGKGNCEIALLSETVDTLAPASGGTISREQLTAIAFSSRYEAPPAITLLGVAVAPDHVQVTLARGLTEAAALEYLVGAAWEVAAPLPSGDAVLELKLNLAAGCAVRVRQGDAISNVCFVADPRRYNRTQVEHVGSVRTNEEELFTDAGIAEAIAREIAELRQFLPATGAAGSGGGGGGGGSPGTVTFTSWEEYLDACEARIGDRLLAYGLALPALGSGEGIREEGETGMLAGEGGEDGEDGAGAIDILEPDPDGGGGPKLKDLPASQRNRYRRWCERLAELSPELPYAGRLVALRLLLDAVRGELFTGPEAWLPLVADATGALAASYDGFEEEITSAASLAAVSLAAMRGQLHRYGDWEDLRFPYDRAAEAVTPLLEHADADKIERYCSPLQTFFGAGVVPAAVVALADRLLHPDLIGEAVRLAEEELGLTAERRGNVIELNDPIDGDARRTLISIISLCDKADVVVTTPTWATRQALAIWCAPELLLVTSNASAERGALYVLRGFGPGAYKDDIQGLPRPVEQWLGPAQVPERSRVLMEAAGFGN